MSVNRRAILQAGAALSAASALPAFAQAFPNKPVKIVVPYQPGGLVDSLARAVAAEAGKLLGQPVIIDNRPGAGGNIGIDVVAKSPADGYTLLAVLAYALPSSAALYSKLPFDPRKDLVSVTEIAYNPGIIVINASLPVKSFKELVAYAKANPNKVSIGSWAPGSTPHAIQTYMSKQLGAPVLHVPYKGESPIVTDLLGGQINMAYVSSMAVKQHMASGKLRALATLGTRRNKIFPDVPTMAEAGFPQDIFKIEPPTSLFAPKGIPADVLATLGKAMSTAALSPPVRKFIDEIGTQAVGNLPAKAQANFEAYYPMVKQMTEDTGAKLD